MNILKVSSCENFAIEIDSIASDKSISHRCAIFSLLSDKTSYIKNFLLAEDTLNTLKIIKSLGAKIKIDSTNITITPPKTLNEPPLILDCGNSGTAIRLMIGFLASKRGFFVLHGDKYLANRPMKRVVTPLREIGAIIDGRDEGNYSPISIRGASLKGFKYSSKISSAQVKTAMILAALNAKKRSYFKEPTLSRDHTERMLKGMGAKLKIKDDFIEIKPLKKALKPLNINIPADPSSGFFFALAVAITPNAKVVLKNISLNKTRIEAYKILQKMGVKVKFIKKEDIYEPIGDIIVEFCKLNAIKVDKNIAWLIDELPALSIAMALAKGKSRVANAKELRVKESDRISSVVDNLKLCGVKVKEFEDGYEIVGGELKKATINSCGDHRIAMSFAIAGLKNGMNIEGIECINTSFPNFITILNSITRCKIED